jgi:C1A family cysteine protease
VLASIGVPPSFRSPDANGYVQYVAGQVASGNHLVLLVGFVSNADLPAGAPTDPGGEGFFIAKNSWGVGYGDCGFAYLSFELVTLWHDSFWYLDDDVD